MKGGAPATSVLGATLALGNAAIQKGVNSSINAVGNLVGVDINKQPNQVLGDIKQAIQNPQTQQMIRNTGMIAASAYKAAEPGINQMIDQTAEMAEKAGKKAIIVGQELLGEVPIVGPILELPFIASNVVKAAEEVVSGAANIAGTGAQTLSNVKNAIDVARSTYVAEANKLARTLENDRNSMLQNTNSSIQQFTTPHVPIIPQPATAVTVGGVRRIRVPTRKRRRNRNRRTHYRKRKVSTTQIPKVG